jgi:ABC transport system ATP-binding/permease protein
MSEEILRALMQLFALLVKQDEGVEPNEIEYVENFLNQQLNDEAASEYLDLFKMHAGLLDEGAQEDKAKSEGKIRLTSVKDSVRILGICKKINKTLTQKQKVVVQVRLFEIVNAGGKFTDQRMAIINTVAEAFKLDKEEFEDIKRFVLNSTSEELDFPSMMVINNKNEEPEKARHIKCESENGEIYILQIKSEDLYFLRYTGTGDVYLNGLPLNNLRIYLFASGSTIKLPKGKPVYYSDVVSHYLTGESGVRISYQSNAVGYRFSNGGIGLHDISFSEGQGRLIGIMGASGAGKTTLLNVLSGTDNPTSGEVRINNINLHTEREKLEGVIGLIPQDDLLIEELTVFENLYYNAKLCFRDKTEEEIATMVERTLSSLGLLERRDMKVGSPMNKVISGGQRKRLNIALELIREPSILFVDEPTSGLSSRDSENVMDLLRELTLKGKLIFVVIHQPSSDIYKMFDNIMILDTGGYMIYYGNPVEGVMYFKRIDAQINSDIGECPDCGNVNPELIFNIIEARVVDELGRYTPIRKVSPKKWESFFRENVKIEPVKAETNPPPATLNIPSWFRQLKIYSLRDFFSKISNKQYIVLNLLEAPLLAFILAYIIRYIADPNSGIYIFRENENIPVYIFMSLIVALFLGLTISAEEIFRDRKILKREAFLNLSRSSYLLSKIVILFCISAIQALLFVWTGNTILGVQGMNFEYWLTLFSIAAFANMLGLNISASFNSAVTIYILIPLLMIPQMILGGAMFSFEKLNRTIGSVDKVPLIAEIMPTKWTYEALMVHQYKDNAFQKRFYELEKKESMADFQKVYWLPEMRSRLDIVIDEFNRTGAVNESKRELQLIDNEIQKERVRMSGVSYNGKPGNERDNFSMDDAVYMLEYFDELDLKYTHDYQESNRQKENTINFWMRENPENYRYLRDAYFNESLADIVKKVFEKNQILEYKGELVQQINPIYRDPLPGSYLNFRSHFYAPNKHFMGRFYDTFYFNIIFVWILTLILYATLYFNLLKKSLEGFEKLDFKMSLPRKPTKTG